MHACRSYTLASATDQCGALTWPRSASELTALPRSSSRLSPSCAASVVRGAVLLATCNRFELYVDATEFHTAVDGARNLIKALADPDLSHIDPALTVYVGDGAVEHLFKGSCGLDSMVVGEQEIACLLYTSPSPR